MTYRDEKEEQPARVVHEWHALPKINEETAIRAFFGALLTVLAMGLASLAFLIYDWRQDRKDGALPVTSCGVIANTTGNDSDKYDVVARRGRADITLARGISGAGAAAAAASLLCPKTTEAR